MKVCRSTIENERLDLFIETPGDIMIKFVAPEDRVVHAPGKVTERVTEKENEVLMLLQIDPGIPPTEAENDLIKKIKKEYHLK